MKIIDMLDRISKGEEVKFKIIETDEVLNLTKDMNLFSITFNEPVEWFLDEEWLNYEVEIIEEDKKIEKLEQMNSRDYLENRDEYLSTKDIALDIETLRLWVNKIIDKLNEEQE